MPLLRALVAWCALTAANILVARAQADDGGELLLLKDSIENWSEYSAANNITGWNTSTPVCFWTGVVCSEDARVQQVLLQCGAQCSVQAVGTLPPDFGNIAVLSTFNVQGNAFHGSLPREWGDPQKLTLLQNLYLNNNNFSGGLPPEWAQANAFVGLLLLRLDNNQLSGPLPEIPSEGTSFPALQVMRLYNNSFSSKLPASWTLPTAFPALQILALQQNSLTGPLPPELGGANVMPKLQELYLQGNRLTGGLPASWSGAQAFPNLRFLFLSGNPLGGTLPAQWGSNGSYASLRALGLNATQLTGSLPSEWGLGDGFSSIDTILLANNNISGRIPDSWANFTSLQRLVVAPGNEYLCGPVLPNLPFKLCDEGDPSCLRSNPTLTGTNCPKFAPPVAPPPTGGASGTGSGGGSSFPVAAVAVPVSVVGSLALVVGALFLERRRRRAKEQKAAAVDHTQICGGAHPFDTLEGQAVLTSPFAANAFQRSGSSESRPGRGSGSKSGQSSASGYMAKCARIRTTSLDHLAEAGGSIELQAGQQQRSALPGVFASDNTASTPRTFPGGMPSEELQSDLPFSDWEILPDEIQIAKRPDGSDWELGSGGFGMVYRGLRNGVQPVAVKVLSAGSDLRQMAVTEFRKEIAILKGCRDVNIVSFQGASVSPDRMMLVTELMEGGNLSNNISHGRVTWHKRGKKIALDVAKGLVFLHSKRIVHFDLKSPNILLARDGCAKIADVGMARILNRDYVTGVVGTLAWAAPEMLWGERCTEKVDVYSFGIVLWEICTGETPVRGQLRDVRVPEECPQAVRDLMLQCLETRPAKRPTALQIVERLRDLGLGTEEIARRKSIESPAPRAAVSGGFPASPPVALPRLGSTGRPG